MELVDFAWKKGVYCKVIFLKVITHQKQPYLGEISSFMLQIVLDAVEPCTDHVWMELVDFAWKKGGVS